MCTESHIFASHEEDCSTGEEQRCRRHDHHNGGDVHCVQSEESLIRIAISAGLVELEQVCDVARRKQMKGFERHQYNLVLNMATGLTTMRAATFWTLCSLSSN